MARVKQGTLNIAQLIYVDPVTGEITDSAQTQSIQAKSFWTPNYELNDSILGVYRGAVKDIKDSPPSTPQEGDRYLVSTTPSGLFNGYANQIVEYSRNASNALVWNSEGDPKDGTLLYVKATDSFYRHLNGSWTSAFGGGSTREEGDPTIVYTLIHEAEEDDASEELYPWSETIADNFMAIETCPLGKITARIAVSQLTGEPVSLGCKVYADDDGLMGELIGISDDFVFLNTLNTTVSEVSWKFSNINLTQGDVYWVQLYYSNTVGLSEDVHAIIRYNSEVLDGSWVISNDAVAENIGGELYFKIYKNDGVGEGDSSSAGQVIRANAQGYLDESFLQYDVDFGTNKPRVNPTYTDADTYVIANKGYVDGQLAAYRPGVRYSYTPAVTRAGMLVYLSSNNTVAPLDITTSQEAIGVTMAPDEVEEEVIVLANDNEIDVPSASLQLTNAISVGQRLYLTANGKLDNVPPSDTGYRVWQVGIISDATSGSEKMHVQVVFKKVNA